MSIHLVGTWSQSTRLEASFHHLFLIFDLKINYCDYRLHFYMLLAVILD